MLAVASARIAITPDSFLFLYFMDGRKPSVILKVIVYRWSYTYSHKEIQISRLLIIAVNVSDSCDLNYLHMINYDQLKLKEGSSHPNLLHVYHFLGTSA